VASNNGRRGPDVCNEKNTPVAKGVPQRAARRWGAQPRPIAPVCDLSRITDHRRPREAQGRTMKTRNKQKKEPPKRAGQGQAEGHKASQTKTRRAKRSRLHVPPPESNVWPEEYRGKNWKPAYAILFAGKCQLCAYSCALPKSRQLRDKWHGEPRVLLCPNHPASPGALREVLPTETCRNFKAKAWHPPRAQTPRNSSPSVPDESDRTIRRILLGNNLFAVVDARDHKRLSKYKWRAYRTGRQIYAVCKYKGKLVYMHHMIIQPRKGYVVDHIDGNGLNNRRCNLRVCTYQQNQANARPRGGASGFIGVYRHKKKWQAKIVCRGKYYYGGVYDDPVEAAKARDRLARKLNGKHAWLNLPEEYRR
jgi:hypothetical protein